MITLLFVASMAWGGSADTIEYHPMYSFVESCTIRCELTNKVDSLCQQLDSLKKEIAKRPVIRPCMVEDSCASYQIWPIDNVYNPPYGLRRIK